MNEVLQALFDLWKYDVGVMSNPWMYIPLCIPILFYLSFFFVKWLVLTTPLWLSVCIILYAWKKE